MEEGKQKLEKRARTMHAEDHTLHQASSLPHPQHRTRQLLSELPRS